MTRVDFYALKRAVQDSLLESLAGHFAPLPIAVKRGPRPDVAMWFAIAGVSVLALVALAVTGYGSVGAGLALEPTWMVVLYAVFASTAAIGVLNAVAARGRRNALMFAPGIFVFPANVIDAREHVLKVYPLEEATAVKAGPASVTVAFGGKAFELPVEAGRADEVAAAIEKAREKMNGPLDAEARERLDPLATPSVASPFAPTDPHTHTVQSWERLRLPFGALIGCVVGAALFFSRNAMSDAKMLATARAKDDVASYRAYLGRGTRHKDLVSQVLLPRAALREAIAGGSVEAIDAFKKDYPATGIGPEVDTARRAALIAEFEKARAAGTLAALLAYSDRHPDHAIGAPYNQAKHALYTKAAAAAKKTSADDLDDAVGKLVAWAEKAGSKKTEAGFRGPVVEIRFRRMPSKDLERSDDLVRKNPMFSGAPSLPTVQLAPGKIGSHEQRTGDAMAAALVKGFDPEVLSFATGAPVAGDADPPPPTVPTILVEYRIEPSGNAFACRKPRGIFLGLNYFFTVSLVIPGDKDAPKTKLTLQQKIPFKDIQADPNATGLEATIYQAMTRDAFDELRERYVGKWLLKGERAK